MQTIVYSFETTTIVASCMKQKPTLDINISFTMTNNTHKTLAHCYSAKHSAKLVEASFSYMSLKLDWVRKQCLLRS